MNLFEKLGRDTFVWLNENNRKKQLAAVHHEPKGARVVMVTGEMRLLAGLDKDETTRLFMYLGFNGCGKHGFDTPAFAPFLTPDAALLARGCQDEVANKQDMK